MSKIRSAVETLRDYGVYIVLAIAAIAVMVLTEGNQYGEYFSLFILKPVVKLIMLFVVIQFSYRKVDFQDEILDRNTAAGLVFLGVALVIAYTV